jgi:DNA invertase Pin-like site-specific DNA recombinase
VKFVSYLRVSTQKQGASGLGLEAQRAAVVAFIDPASITAEYVEVESGKRADRPELAKAIAHAKRIGARLVIAKLDRLARNVAFVSGLMEAGVDFVAVDMPDANRLTIHIIAAVAEHEARAISERTKAALAAAKARGVVLGGYRGHTPKPDVEALKRAARNRAGHALPVARALAAQGLSNKAIARALEAQGVLTPAGATQWQGTQVKRLLAIA